MRGTRHDGDTGMWVRHGAIGYSYEYDLHLFLKRAWALEATWGDAPWHRARVGRAIMERARRSG